MNVTMGMNMNLSTLCSEVVLGWVCEWMGVHEFDTSHCTDTHCWQQSKGKDGQAEVGVGWVFILGVGMCTQ